MALSTYKKKNQGITRSLLFDFFCQIRKKHFHLTTKFVISEKMKEAQHKPKQRQVPQYKSGWPFKDHSKPWNFQWLGEIDAVL